MIRSVKIMKKHEIITNEIKKVINDIYKHSCDASDKAEFSKEESTRNYAQGLCDAYTLSCLKLQKLVNLIERGDIFENN